MAYERYGRDTAQGGNNDWDRDQYGASSERDYRAGGERGGYGARGYGQREDNRSGYDQGGYGQNSYGQTSYGQGAYGQRDDGNQRYGQNDRFGRGDDGGQGLGGGSDYYRGDRQAYGQDTYRQSRGTFDRQPQRYGRDEQRDQDRGFFDRAGDEVRSWFGDADAERRREQDARADAARDRDYRSWRDQQVASFDRDYDEYRQENQTKFHNEFSTWRTDRQGQRSLLGQVTEHQEVVGSDGAHVGTVDKVRGDRIILTKSDVDAGGRHHSIPSRWLQSVDGGKLTLRKTAAEAKQHWQDEERQQTDRGAMFGEDRQTATGTDDNSARAALSRSFSGSY